MSSILTDSPNPPLAHVHVSARFRYVYVDTPKTGCSTIKRTLNNLEGQDCANTGASGAFGYSADLMRVHDRTVMHLGQPDSPAGFKAAISAAPVIFAFVRNPYTRVLSAYLDKIASRPDRRDLFLQEISPHRSGQTPSFPDFLDIIADQQPMEMNPHWRIQRFHLAFGVVGYTHIGAFETFQQDFARVLHDLGLPNDRVTVLDEHRTDAGAKLSQHYNEAAVRRVRRIYAKDFAAFGYSLDPAEALKPPTRPVV